MSFRATFCDPVWAGAGKMTREVKELPDLIMIQSLWERRDSSKLSFDRYR